LRDPLDTNPDGKPTKCHSRAQIVSYTIAHKWTEEKKKVFRLTYSYQIGKYYMRFQKYPRADSVAKSGSIPSPSIYAYPFLIYDLIAVLYTMHYGAPPDAAIDS
jgi:hypothetical protein